VSVYELELPLLRGKPPLTHNQRLHHMEKARRVAAVRKAAAWRAKEAGVPSGCRHVIAQLHYATGDNRRRDAPNLTATSKPAIDGLVDARVVSDDHDGYVTEVMPRIHNGPGKRRLWLRVEIDR
jgi:crossover junction endodeoxyribonuclease RusA